MSNMMYRPLTSSPSVEFSRCTKRGRGALEECAEDFPEIRARPLALVEDHPQCRAEDDRPVSNIAEHDREQERECDDGKETRVDLLVRRHAVRVHDCLEALRELVCPMERGRGLVRAQFMQDRRHGGARFLLQHHRKKKKISRPEVSARKINKRSRWRDGAPAGS
jgi:hypothetical protein